MQFLIGLNADYKTMRGNLIMMRPLLSLSQAYNVILQEEKQRSFSLASHIVSQSSAFNVQTPLGSRIEQHTGNDHVALVGQQRGNYSFNYKARNDHPTRTGSDRRLL